MLGIGRYVNDAVKALNAQKAVDFHKLKEAWYQAVGPILAGQAEPTRLRGSTLHVTVSSPAWSQEIQMQQRLILKRLKNQLASPPTKIACWVGQPHSAAPPRPKERRLTAEAQVPWATAPIPADRQASIEATLTALSDPQQQEKLRPLLELAVRRELHYLALGQLPCPECGQMRPAEQESCDACLAERRERAENKLLRLMARRPWLKIRDLQDSAPWATRGQILRLRKALHSNLLMQAWQLSEGTEGAELEKKMNGDFRKLLLDVTMLRCYLPPASLRPHHFQHALGKRLSKAFLADRQEPANTVADD